MPEEKLRLPTGDALDAPGDSWQLWHCERCPLTLSFWCVNRLTKQEQLVLCIVLGLLLTGWAVKAYRTAHPPAQATDQSHR